MEERRKETGRPMNICPQCGAPLKKEKQVYRCEYCGSEFPLEQTDVDLEQEKARWERERRGEKKPWSIGNLTPAQKQKLKTWALVALAAVVLLVLLGKCAGGRRGDSTSDTAGETVRQVVETSPSPSPTPAPSPSPSPTPTPTPTPSPTPSPTSQPVTHPQRDGFDMDTNRAVSRGGVWFFLPDYCALHESESSDRMDTYWIFNGMMPEGMAAILTETVDSTAEEFRLGADSLVEGYMARYEDYRLEESRSTEVAGLPAQVITGLVPDGDGGFNEDHVTFLYNEETGELVLFWMTLLQQREYDYDGDYQTILDYAVPDARPSPEPVPESSPEPTPEPAPEPSPEPVPEPSPTPTGDPDTVSPEVKEFYDSYEALLDEYLAFMKDYNADDPAMLSRYMELMGKVAEFSSKSDWYQSSLTGADSDYANQAMLRISFKLLLLLSVT